MTYIVIIAAIIAGAYFLFYVVPKRNILATIHNASRIINISVALYLAKKYEPNYGREFGSSLAAAVANKLFGAQPGNETGRAFLVANEALIAKELAGVRHDSRICQMVSLVTHMKANTAGYTRTVNADMIQSWAELRELGILLPKESLQMPSSLDDFMRMAREFELWAMKN